MVSNQHVNDPKASYTLLAQTSWKSLQQKRQHIQIIPQKAIFHAQLIQVERLTKLWRILQYIDEVFRILGNKGKQNTPI